MEKEREIGKERKETDRQSDRQSDIGAQLPAHDIPTPPIPEEKESLKYVTLSIKHALDD